MTDSVKTAVLDILEHLTRTPEVRDNLDLPLYDLELLDSMQTVRLIVALSDTFEISISPAEFDPVTWATPSRIIADVEHRLAEPK